MTLLLAIAFAEDVPRDAPGEVMPTRSWDIEHLELSIRLFPAERRIEGRTVHTIRALQPHRSFRLHQEGLEIEAATVDGEAVQVRLGEGFVEVPVPPGGSHQVELTYTASPQRGMWFRSKVFGNEITEVWTQGEDMDHRHWFPSWDYPNDLFTVSTDVVAPKALTVRANGVQIRAEPEGDQMHWRFELEQPIVNYLVAIVAGDYQVLTDDSARVPLEILGSRKEKPAVLRNGAGLISEMLPYYEALLGTPYPYPIYRQAYVQGFLYSGMENASLTVLSDERLVNPKAPARVSRIESVVAHELAHQWFGDLLTCYGWRELWLNEGFATYYEKRWKEHTLGKQHAAASWFQTRVAARDVKGPMAARARTKQGKDNAGVYVRGSSVLHALEVHVGREVFDAVIQRWVRENQHQLVESESLRRVFEDATGEHFGWLFDQWVTGAGAPTWKASWSHQDGQLTVEIVAEEGPTFYSPVEIEIGGAEVSTHTVWVNGRSTKLVFPSEQAPRWVSIDPRGGVIGTFEMDQSDESWTNQLRKSPSPLAQLDAVAALKRSGYAPATLALAELANSDADAYFRKHVIKALATHPTQVARDALIVALSDEDAYTRDNAARALRHHKSDGHILVALRRTIAEDPDPMVRARAIDTLARLLGPYALPMLRKRLERGDSSRLGVEHITALEQLEQRGTLEDARAALPFLGKSYPRWVRATALDTVAGLLLKAEGGQKERLQRGFVKRVRPLLDHPDLRLRQRAVAAYAAAHPDDLEDLKRFQARSTVASEREHAAEVLRQHGKRPEPNNTEALEKRVKALEDGSEATSGRLDALERWRL